VCVCLVGACFVYMRSVCVLCGCGTLCVRLSMLSTLRAGMFSACVRLVCVCLVCILSVCMLRVCMHRVYAKCVCA